MAPQFGNLFVFGFGYTAEQFAAVYRDRFARICGTVRSPGRAGSLRNAGIVPYCFDSEGHDIGLEDELAQADALLISIPPGSGPDPVLARFDRAIATAPRLRWVGYLSTIGVYGDADGAWVDETTPPDPLNERSRRRLAAEAQWLELGETAPFAVHIFRLAGIYGPGRNALRRVAEGTARRIIKPGQVFNRIHVADIAQVLMASMEHPRRSTIYNVVDDEPGPPQDIISYAADLLGCPPPPEIAFDEAHLEPMAASFYEDNKRVRNGRIKEDLGVKLLYPTYRHGLRALYGAGEGTPTSGA